MAGQAIQRQHHYQHYSDFLEGRFNEKINRVSVDAGMSCPHRSSFRGGTGCIFCNNDNFRPTYADPSLPLEAQVAMGLRKLKKERRFIIYFQSFSNTFNETGRLRELYEQALAIPGCVGISIGTRPDCIDDEKLDLLEELARRSFVTVEYGLQSPHPESLAWMNRGHSFECFQDAVEKTAGRGIFTATHIILGIPGETEEMMLKTAEMISCLPLHFLKIHQLQVIRDTPLAGIYGQNPFPLWEFSDYADTLGDFLERLKPSIVIQRLFSLSHTALLIGPRWGMSRWFIERLLEEQFRDKGIQQGRKWKG